MRNVSKWRFLAVSRLSELRVLELNMVYRNKDNSVRDNDFQKYHSAKKVSMFPNLNQDFIQMMNENCDGWFPVFSLH